MAQIRLVNPEELAPPRGFSHAAVACGWIWLGGQIATDRAGTVLHPGDIAAQFERTMINLDVALRAAGGSPADAVKLTIYVTDVAAYRGELKRIGSAYRSVFGNHYPAMSLFEVAGLFEPDAMVEIECVAIQRSDP